MYEFARKFGIDIVQVIEGGDITEAAYAGDGRMINSDFLNGLTNKKDSIARMVKELEKLGVGEAGVQYKMKDWAFNRQRYWGEPIPIVHCPDCGVVPVPYEELPLRLPKVDNFEPGQEGESPLAGIESFVNCTCPKCKGAAKRETDTMPQWAGSSWYFLRYIDPHNQEALADPEKLKYWMPVDWYNGGMEHVTRHMIYSRFWHHFLYDMGVVNTEEPYAKRTAQGLILGPDGDKMSKSKGNVVDPLDVVEEFGADVLRTYVLFMGDYGAATPWSDSSVKGCKRFLEPFLPGQKVVERDGALHMEPYEKSIGMVKELSGNFLVVVKALSYVLTLGPDGIADACKNAVLNANYVRVKLSDYYHMPFKQTCMHEFVMSLEQEKEEMDVTAMDIAKALLDHGIHPPTMYFPLIVHEALMVEPTETESKENLDELIAVFHEIYETAKRDPEYIRSSPHITMVKRLDEVNAARNPKLHYAFGEESAEGEEA